MINKDISLALQNERRQEAQKREESGKNNLIRASSIGMCKRRIGYGLLGYPGTPDTSHSLVTLNLGNAIHDMLQRHLVKMGWIKAKPVLSEDGFIDWEQADDPQSGCELGIYDEKLRFTGHCDGVTVPLIEDPDSPFKLRPGEGGKRYLIEIKSITDRPIFFIRAIRDGGVDPIREEDNNSEFIDLDMTQSKSSKKFQQLLYNFSHSRQVVSKFGRRTCPVYKVSLDGNKEEMITVLMVSNMAGKFSNLQKPQEDHIMQASLYASRLGLEDILFIYVGKDVDPRSYKEDNMLNVPIKTFHHKVDPDDVTLAEVKIEEIYSFTDQNELPPRDFEPTDKECSWCPFLWTCYPDLVDLEALNSTLKKHGFETLK